MLFKCEVKVKWGHDDFRECRLWLPNIQFIQELDNGLCVINFEKADGKYLIAKLDYDEFTKICKGWFGSQFADFKRHNGYKVCVNMNRVNYIKSDKENRYDLIYFDTSSECGSQDSITVEKEDTIGSINEIVYKCKVQ